MRGRVQWYDCFTGCSYAEQGLCTTVDGRAADTQKADTKKADTSKASSPGPPKDIGGNFIPVLKPEDLPKGLQESICFAFDKSAELSRSCCETAGVRKEVKVQGVGVLIFWYRNELYAIEAR